MSSAITPALLLAAFLILLLISLSLPIIKSIYIFRLAANVSEGFGIVSGSATGSVKFGVWGYCISAIQITAFGQNVDSTDSQCSKVKLGYTLDSTVSRALGVSGLTDILTNAITAALVLHPIACGLTFIAFLFSLGLVARRASASSRIFSILTLGSTLIAAMMTTIVFLIDVIFVAVVRSRVKNATDGGVTGSWGNAVWMALGATIALWLSCMVACAGVCSCNGGRRRKNVHAY